MKSITKKERVIAQQWASGLISFTTAYKKLNRTPQSAYIILARALRQIHYQNN